MRWGKPFIFFPFKYNSNHKWWNIQKQHLILVVCLSLYQVTPPHTHTLNQFWKIFLTKSLSRIAFSTICCAFFLSSIISCICFSSVVLQTSMEQKCKSQRVVIADGSCTYWKKLIWGNAYHQSINQSVNQSLYSIIQKEWSNFIMQ